MFEKEAEEYCLKRTGYGRNEFHGRKLRQAFKDGAEFGYNKAKVEVEESYRESLCNSELNLASVTEQLEELKKANKWHFVKDGKYPTHSYRVLVFTDEGIGFGIYGLDDKKWHTYDTGFDVIAWKEIILPKEIE